MERLTEDVGLYGNETEYILTAKTKYINSSNKEKPNYQKAINKLGQLEDIMEKYHIESIEELDLRLSLMSTFVLDKNKDIKEK